jgi:hypothetical protein
MQYAVYVGELELPGWLIFVAGTVLILGLTGFLFGRTDTNS